MTEQGSHSGPILVTNDDGFEAAGLQSMVTELVRRLPNRVVVVAPLGERSAVGHSITLREELLVRRVSIPGLPSVTAFGVAGTPVDCVKLGVRVLLEAPPVLVVSGINHGYNLGTDVFYSGTVSAALEAAILGFPSLAASTDREADHTAPEAAAFVAELAERVLERGLPERTILNVNVPAHRGGAAAATRTGFDITRLGFRSYQNVFRFARRSADDHYYVLVSETLTNEEEPGTDVASVLAGRISVTPVHLDLTNHAVLQGLAEWLR